MMISPGVKHVVEIVIAPKNVVILGTLLEGQGKDVVKMDLIGCWGVVDIFVMMVQKVINVNGTLNVNQIIVDLKGVHNKP